MSFKRIVIVGDAIQARLCALWLAINDGGGDTTYEIVVVNEPLPPVISIGPDCAEFCEELGLSPASLLVACDGAFYLGDTHRWPAHQWFTPLGCFGLGGEHQQIETPLIALLREQPQYSYDDFSLAAVAARQHRFAITANRLPHIQQAMAYGINVSSEKLVKLLAALCEQRGITQHHGAISKLHRQQDQLTQIVLNSGLTIDASLWLDCSAGRQLFGAAKAGQDWRLRGEQYQLYAWNWYAAQAELPSARCLQRYPFGYVQQQSIASGSYGVARVEQHQQAAFIQWCSQHNINATLYVDKQHSGYSAAPWQGNCVALGSAAVCHAWPLYNLIDVLLAQLQSWRDYWPDASNLIVNQQMFNRHWQPYVEELGEYILALQQDMTCPVSWPVKIEHHIQLFQNAGRLVPAQTDAIPPQRWYSLMLGQGIRPKHPDVQLLNLTRQQWQVPLMQQRQNIEALAAGLPAHREFIQRFIQASMANQM